MSLFKKSEKSIPVMSLSIIPKPVLSIIFSFQYGKEMFVQKSTSKSVKEAIEYTDVMKILKTKMESGYNAICVNGRYFSRNAFDVHGKPASGRVMGSCGDFTWISECILCGEVNVHSKC